MASAHDDTAGMSGTYCFLGKRSALSQVSDSSMTFIIAVNAALFGLLVADIAGVFGASTPLVIAVGGVSGAVFLAVSLWVGGRRFCGFWRTHIPLFPTPNE